MELESLDQQLGLYRDQSGIVEDWQDRHEEVQLCWKVEDAIRLGLTVLDGLERRNAHWISEVRDTPSFDWSEAEQIALRFRGWREVSKVVLKAIELCESMKYTIEGADELRAKFDAVSGMSLDTERVKEAVESTRTLTHSEALNVLRARIQRRSA